LRVCLILLTLFSLNSQAQTITIKRQHFAIIGEPKYAAGFHHFDYVNPQAPKGGTLTNATIGTFDNFNRYALRGNPGTYRGALRHAVHHLDDEPGSYYPLIAADTRYADDFHGWRSRSIRAPVS
jgi:microcin C transport system substrate-binding protein